MATTDADITPSPKSPPRLATGETTGLVRIQVDGLLGRYSYRIPASETIPASDSQLVILYGDNGSGKTTLLKLIFHLLSPSDERGHIGELLSANFSRLRLELADATVLEARRASSDSAQPTHLDITITRNGQTLASVRYGMPKPADSTPTEERVSLRHQVASAMASIGLDVYFLTDNRRLLSDVLAVEEDPSSVLYWQTATTGTSARRRPAQPGKEVSDAMGRASEWIFKAAVGQSGQGDRSTNSIYEEVIAQIASAKPGRPSITVSREDLTQRLGVVARQTNDFAEFGLMAPFSADRLVRAVQSMPAGRLAMVRRILLPYIEGLDARISALRPIRELINTFVSTINSFFVDKALRYSLGAGFQVVTLGTSRPGVLDPDGLSSGERQLLLLFCNVLPARDHKSLFIIDEPELSLNVKWQRQLVSSLLRCTEGSDIQFLLATHSIELLTQHERNVQRLVAP